MMISARPPPSGAASWPGAWPVSGAVTVTIALTSRPPAGRYSFWKTSTVKLGSLIGESLLVRFPARRLPPAGPGRPEGPHLVAAGTGSPPRGGCRRLRRRSPTSPIPPPLLPGRLAAAGDPVLQHRPP